MRFFSNDKESRDDQQGVDVQERAQQVNPDQAGDQHPERVASDPVSVPQQRSGSPWSSAPDTADTSDTRPAPRERAEGADDGSPPFHEPASPPTAFGASTVGGAVAASAMANPQNDTRPATGRDPAAGDDRPVATGDGAAGAQRDDLPVAGTRDGDVVDVAPDDQGTFDDPHVRNADTTTREDTTPPDTRIDVAADSTVEGTAGTAAAGTLAGATVAGSTGDHRDDDPGDRIPDRVITDDGTFDAPRAVDPGTDRPLDATGEPAVAATGDPAVAATGATPGPSAPPLFGADDARSFRDRWRDVQLRFVDSPKEATAEAAGLLDEAVDRLSARLRDQKSELSGGGDDTEKLRVELRGYRDMLNRILDL